ncbi:MAG: hypothetical protein JXR84_26375 [Anaerolineae bacterium]|nr:hypothetical protein [Anaerolineae bacterium]
MVKKGLLVVVVVSLLVLAVPTIVAAQGGRPPAQAARSGASTGTGTGTGTGNASAWRGAQQGGWLTGGVSLVDATAEATGMAVTDVVAALQSGQTYADLAAQAGVTLQDIVDVVLAVRTEALTQAVAEGRFTQAEADAMLAEMAEDLLEQLNGTWEMKGAGNGSQLDGTQPLDGSGYRGGKSANGATGRGNARTDRPMYNAADCVNPQS